MSRSLKNEVAKVVERGNCSGCGMCSQLSSNIKMTFNDDGYLRPTWDDDVAIEIEPQAVSEFSRACPGVTVEARLIEGGSRHSIFGPVISAWEAWAIDPSIRHSGSSGGTLTAIVSWLLDTGQYTSSAGVVQSPADARVSTAVALTTKEEALKSAGSRYAPVAAAGCCRLDSANESIFVGKPCDVSAVKQLLDARGSERPLLLSFFCAGTPSQFATERLIQHLGIDTNEERVEYLRYRGNGWPGDFTVRTDGGRTVTASYNDSWGRFLGPTTQWRCKICPDGIGESADITAGDFWHADGRGYPDFGDREGTSVLVARTALGDSIIRRAISSGVLGAKPADLSQVAAVQPLQVRRRTTLAGRMAGATLGGRRLPRYRGFQLLRTARLAPLQTLRSAVGSFVRVREEAERRPVKDRRRKVNATSTAFSGASE
ncbi:Coenzyme F420 hydrogenase/dehydrogenase, beta subunit C-terminal domain [Rhodococcus aetherivorans]|uniref:Coenzyme F420 hydrogenase/dehydrogenase, beta subunit C-terminal domain n=1 Tax=Rhodococcus aetherivorans TaxID=191292 RepID=UPI003101505B